MGFGRLGAPVKRLLGGFALLPKSMTAIFGLQILVRGGDFVFPFLALFLTRRLALDSSQAGSWVAGAGAAGLAGMLSAGIVGDKLGRRTILGIGLAGTAVLIGLAGFLPRTMLLAIVLVCASFFQGALKPLISAIVMDICPPELRREGFSLSYLGTNIGVAVGPLIAARLFAANSPWLFWGDALLLIGACGLILRFIPGVSAEGKGDARIPGAGGGERIVRVFSERPLLLAFYPLTFLIGFAYSQTGFGLSLYASASFGDNGPAVFGSMMSLNAAIVLIATIFVTRLTRGMSPILAMSLGTAFYAIGFGMLSLRLEVGLLILSTVTWTQGEILLSINTGPFLASQAPANWRGRMQSFREILFGLGGVASPIAFGRLAASEGMSAAWLMISLVSLVSASAFAGLSIGKGKAPGERKLRVPRAR
jgi:MFS family permease